MWILSKPPPQINLPDATSRRRCHKNVAGFEGESKTCTMLTMVFFFAAANWVPCCKRLKRMLITANGKPQKNASGFCFLFFLSLKVDTHIRGLFAASLSWASRFCEPFLLRGQNAAGLNSCVMKQGQNGLIVESCTQLLQTVPPTTQKRTNILLRVHQLAYWSCNMLYIHAFYTNEGICFRFTPPQHTSNSNPTQTSVLGLESLFKKCNTCLSFHVGSWNNTVPRKYALISVLITVVSNNYHMVKVKVGKACIRAKWPMSHSFFRVL